MQLPRYNKLDKGMLVNKINKPAIIWNDLSHDRVGHPRRKYAPLSVVAIGQLEGGKAHHLLEFYLNKICLLVVSKLLTSANKQVVHGLIYYL